MMKLLKSKNANVNYLSKVVNISSFREHPNAQKLKCCTVDGFNVIVGIDYQPGFYIYFPTLSQINPNLLSYANLYRHKELNRDQEQSGMFDDNGKVTTIMLRKEISEGFLLPVDIFKDYVVNILGEDLDTITENTEFDIVKNEKEEFWISKKYIPKSKGNQVSKKTESKSKSPKRFNRIREDQFRLHYSTIIIRKCPFVIKPGSFIHLSHKIHGSSGISAYVLCHQPLNWKQKIAKWLTGESFDKYDYVYSSRTIIKNRYYNSIPKEDVWFEADKIVRPHLSKGMSVYYEIVGYLPNGKYIQKNYDYGCVPPKEGEDYTSEKHFKVRVYRVTMTNIDGEVVEYSPLQVEQWCHAVGLIPVERCYFGRAKDLYVDYDENNFGEQFIEKLSKDNNFYMEMKSPHCKNSVPHEGLVIKLLDRPEIAFKLKCFNFLSKIDMSDEANIEDNN